MLLDLQGDAGADGDGGVGGDDAVVLLEGFGDQALLRVGQQLPAEEVREEGRDLVGARDLWGWHRGGLAGPGASGCEQPPRSGPHRGGDGLWGITAQRGGCRVPVLVSPGRCPLLPAPSPRGLFATPFPGPARGRWWGGGRTRNWMWQPLSERNQVRLARLWRMRIWLLTTLSGQLRDRFTSVTGELQEHETPSSLSSHSARSGASKRPPTPSPGSPSCAPPRGDTHGTCARAAAG